MLASIGGGFFSETFNSIKNATKDRRPITLADGHRTSDYQVWRIALGEKEKGVERYVVNTNPIILKELLDDRAGMVIYKKLLEVSPERLYPADYYYLEYRLPKSPFSIRVKINDNNEVKRCYYELAKLEHKTLMHLAESSLDGLKLVPRISGQPVFNFEPEDLVTVPGNELKTTAALTAFLSDLYLAGRISATDFDGVMHQSSSDMRKETFTLIPPREQPKHEYLLKPSKSRKILENEDKYHLGLVNLKEYAALKRPDLAKLDNRLVTDWPKPERTFICVVCGEDVATIKCIECENRCCRSCIRRNFSEHLNSNAGEFVPTDKLPLLFPSATADVVINNNENKNEKKKRKSKKKITENNEKIEDMTEDSKIDFFIENDKNESLNKRKSNKKSILKNSDENPFTTTKAMGGIGSDVGLDVGLEVQQQEYKEENIIYQPQTFLLIHHIYCLRNGRPSKDFLRGLHHYENRMKSNIKKHHKKKHQNK